MCVSILCTTFVWNIFRSTKKWTRHDKKYILVWNVIYPLIFLQILMEIEFSQQIFESIQTSNFMKIRAVVPSGWTDRH